MKKIDEYTEAMNQLFSARWNVPQAAKHCGLSNEDCKEAFKQYCLNHPTTYKFKKTRNSLAKKDLLK
jgi:hypothetical protein